MQARNCIKCGEVQQRFDVEGTEVDVCPGCGGIWLDDGAIGQLARHGEAALAEIASVNEQTGAGRNARQKRGSTAPPDVIDRPCPACSAKLTIATVGETNIELCSGCQGIYLDRGELDKLMAVLGSSVKSTIVAFARSVRTSGVIG